MRDCILDVKKAHIAWAGEAKTRRDAGMNALDVVSLAIEVLVVVLALRIAVSKKSNYGYLIALTFAIYVFYDSTRFLVVSVDQTLTSLLFLIASASIFFAVWRIYKQQ